MCKDLSILFSSPVSEGSETRLPKPGGEEINVTLSFIMASGDIYVRKEAEAKPRNSEVIILCDFFMISISSFRLQKETLQY